MVSSCHRVGIVIAIRDIFMAMEWSRHSSCSSLPCPYSFVNLLVRGLFSKLYCKVLVECI